MKKFLKTIAVFIIFLSYIIMLTNISEGASTYYQTVKSGISSFPESYRTRLQELSQKYPNWRFQAYYTGISWDELIKKERDESVYRNRVTVNAPDSWKHCGFVDDGWACASDDIVKYYLDPRNFLNETQIFQFVETSYNPDVQTLSAIEKSVKGTFLDATITCKDFNNQMITRTYSQIIIEAAKKTNISAFYIKSKIIQEVGTQGSGSVSGRYPGYEGYYNFFNYGAYDEGDDIANGLQYAKDKGWDSQYKAIVGGAELIGKYYINAGQNTAYFNKWDVVGTKILKVGESQTVAEKDLFWHQYMTNIQDPTSQSYNTKKLYENSINDNITFIIPVYDNMPASNPMPSDVKVTGLSFDKDIYIVNIDEKGKIIKNVTPSNATNKDVVWSVADPEIVRVYNGEFRGLKEGTTTVTGKTIDGGYTATCTIYVRNPNKNYIKDIDLGQELYVVNENEAVDINFSYSPADSANAEFIWESSNPEILSVWIARFRGLKEGSADMICRTKDGTVEKRVRVVVRNPNKKYVENIKIEKEKYDIAVNEAVDINFSYLPEDSANAEFVWEYSNPEILRVWGPRFRGLKEGTAEVICRTLDGTVEARATVTIKYAYLQKIESAEESYIVNINEKGKVGVKFTPQNASNTILYWESSDPETVRVYNGEFRGLKEGKATITATSEEGGYKTSWDVYVRDPNKTYLESISPKQESYTVVVNEKSKIEMNFNPIDAPNKILYWESSDPETVRVYNGEFRGLKEGKATITVTSDDGGLKTTCDIYVKKPIKLESISPKQESYTVDINEKSKIEMNFNPTDATNKILYWESSDPETVRVYNGEFRGLKEGKATITITSDDGGLKTTCDIYVNDPNKTYVENINLPFTEYEAGIDEALDIDFSYDPINSSNAEFVWESSNPEILRVWGPRFRALKEGTAYVIVRTKDRMAEARIKVTIKNYKLQSISPKQESYTVGINEKSKIEMNFNPTNATNKILYWESSDPETVRVYNGEFRGLKEGKATITITSDDGGLVTKCTIYVTDK